MKKLLSSLLLSAISFPFLSTPSKADTNYFVNNSTLIEIFESTVTDSVTTFTKLTTFDRSANGNVFFDNGSYWYDQSLNKLFFQEKNGIGSFTGRHWEYDLDANTWTAITISSDSEDSSPSYGSVPSSYSNSISTNTSNISTNTSAIENLQSSNNLSEAKITTNTNNINKLGEGVAGSTALTAALSALPQMSKESKTTCGVGTGAYSSRYAVGFGCASKVSERIDVNAGGSYVFGGSKSYGGGTLDSSVLKAGFVFKLGDLNKPNQVSFNESDELKKEVKDLKAKNDQLLARLEKLENIALKFQTNSDVISMSK